MSTKPDIGPWVSTERFEPYLKEAGGDLSKAVLLYEWTAALSAASFEAFQYVEVFVRNAMDTHLRQHYRESERGIPWFLLPLRVKAVVQQSIDNQVSETRSRSRRLGEFGETRAQVVAGLSFGFWTGLLKPDFEDLWRSCLAEAFPHSSGNRVDVHATLEPLRVFRNRIAHHDSLLNVDVAFRVQQMLQVAGWIDPAAKDWLSSKERVTVVQSSRPVPRREVVVVPADQAWPFYQQERAYICRAGRSFQPINNLAFYADQEIKAEVPRILYRRDNVDWSQNAANHLMGAKSQDERRLGRIINVSRQSGWTDGRYQVFVLTAPGDDQHITLAAAVTHQTSGRGTGFAKAPRYISREDLRRAVTTVDLVAT